MATKELFFLAKTYKSGRLVILRPAAGSSLTDALEDASAPYALEDGRRILPGVCAALRPLEPGADLRPADRPDVRLILRAEGYHTPARSTQNVS